MSNIVIKHEGTENRSCVYHDVYSVNSVNNGVATELCTVKIPKDVYIESHIRAMIAMGEVLVGKN